MNYNELTHHGIKGQKWGVRRYRNSDGSLTPAGKKRYRSDSKTESSGRAKKIAKAVGNTAAGLAIGYAGMKFSTNPKVVSAVGKAMDKIGSLKVKDVAQTMDSMTDLYSKTLGRNFTVAEAIAAGLSDYI